MAALRGSIDEKWASTDDKQAVLADVSVRVEAVEAVTAAIADLEKAEAAATAAVERTWKKLYAARTEQRVWRKQACVVLFHSFGGHSMSNIVEKIESSVKDPGRRDRGAKAVTAVEPVIARRSRIAKAEADAAATLPVAHSCRPPAAPAAPAN